MVRKPKKGAPKEPAAPASSTPAPEPSQAVATADPHSPKTPELQQTDDSTPLGPAKPAKPAEPKVDAVAMLQALGFDRGQAEAALEAAKGDADRAVEFLMMSGANMQEQEPEPARGSTDIFTEEDNRLSAEPAGPLEQLTSAPEFQHMLQMVRSNPEALPLVMAEVEARWPELVELLEQNQEELQRLIEAAPEEMGKAAQIDTGAELARHAEAVSMLASMFPDMDREMIAQAYHQCGCDQEMAANALLSQAFLTE
eukprot:TRINITY_DN31531_c0_g1_i1.p1 TRINITY_DN31531_c0_g1~~TRINITY_DN31531_c0_g1_i1.p1  ORF type:complete len:255 (-),score=59.32 TRINITY_DN31531_c0_g1_i1:222-986(-)